MYIQTYVFANDIFILSNPNDTCLSLIFSTNTMKNLDVHAVNFTDGSTVIQSKFLPTIFVSYSIS